MTAFVPSETACFASSPGRIRRTLEESQFWFACFSPSGLSCDLRGLDLSGRDGRLLVVGSQLRGLGGDTLEDVVDKRVQDRHGTVGDTSVGVNLLQDCFGMLEVFLLCFVTSLYGASAKARCDKPL